MIKRRSILMFIPFFIICLSWADTLAQTVSCLMLSNNAYDLSVTQTAFQNNMTGVSFGTYECESSTPSVSTLRNYHVVLLMENGNFANAPNVGAVIYDYVHNYNGNVIFATFIWQDWGTWGGYGWGAMEAICPMNEAGGCEYNYDSINPSSVVSHPVTNGITSLWCDLYHGGVGLRSGATRLAAWSDGKPAVAIDASHAYGGGQMVAISIFPSYMNYGTYGTHFGGDFYRLFQNAIRWAGGIGLASVVDYFAAYPLNHASLIEWSTSTESILVGFNLYCSTHESGIYERLNKSLIKAHFGSPEGYIYHWFSDNLENGGIYFYKLKCFYLNTTEFIGPVYVTPENDAVIFHDNIE